MILFPTDQFMLIFFVIASINSGCFASLTLLTYDEINLDIEVLHIETGYMQIEENAHISTDNM
jgi:hypothetical protein